jgi:hypothetical protein
MLPLLLLVALMGTAMIVAAEDLSRRYRQAATGRWWDSASYWRCSPWSFRLGGVLFVLGAIGVMLEAVRQGFLLEGLVAGIVLLPLLVGIAALLALASRRLGVWAIIALLAVVVAVLVLIAER